VDYQDTINHQPRTINHINIPTMLGIALVALFYIIDLTTPIPEEEQQLLELSKTRTLLPWSRRKAS